MPIVAGQRCVTFYIERNYTRFFQRLDILPIIGYIFLYRIKYEHIVLYTRVYLRHSIYIAQITKCATM